LYAYVETFGCQANVRDSENIMGMLAEMGYQITSDQSVADIILFNTCCIREKAEQKVFSRLGALRALKQRKPDLIIGICGCMAQQEGMAALLRRKAGHVDLLMGTQRLSRLPELIAQIRLSGTFQTDTSETGAPPEENLPSLRRSPYKALVNITYGCDNYCTYCVVPYVRGRERSRNMDAVLEELRALSRTGIREVTLLGQNVNTYGRDLDPSSSFHALIQAADRIPGLRRVRYLTSHPRDFSRQIIDAIKETQHVCRHFHLPVQSGSDRVLEMMNRGYTRDYYLALVEYIRRVFPQATVTTDFIVGFPGETDEDFRDTLSLVKEVGFSSAFTFMYSPRKGTPAASMENQIPLAARKERLALLMRAQEEASLAHHTRLKDRVVEVLADEISGGDGAPCMLSGKTEGNHSVVFSGEPSMLGEFVPVRITEPQTWILKGEAVC
jgi:tRNA-2-methylthio-N6-dimethylallyladenosine synthase